MTSTAKKLFAPAQLTTSAAAYYTAPANTRTVLKKITFTNTAAAAVTVTVYIVPSLGSVATSNQLVTARPVAIGETYECYEAEGHVLSPGDTLQAFCSAATSLTVQGSGIEMV